MIENLNRNFYFIFFFLFSEPLTERLERLRLEIEIHGGCEPRSLVIYWFNGSGLFFTPFNVLFSSSSTLSVSNHRP